MSNRIYPGARNLLLAGDLDLVADTIKVQLVSSTYVYSSAHDFFNDITGPLGSPATLTGKAVASGAFTAADVNVTGVSAAAVVRGIVVYKDTGVSSTSPLIAFLDTRGDTVPIYLTATGGAIALSWPQSGRILSMGG